jgi:hypothetical protein
MLGDKIDIPPLTFIYKILDVIFIAINKGLDERILVNMDR